MLLKKEEQNGKIIAIYDSSNILESVFDTSTNNLTITFKVGSQYRYKDVSTKDYTEFELTDSQGRVLNTHIKKYSFEKLNTIDATPLTEEINKLKLTKKKEIINDKKAKIGSTMKHLLSLSTTPTNDLTQDDIDTLWSDGLEKLNTQINEFFNK